MGASGRICCKTLKRNDGSNWLNQYFANPRNIDTVRIPGTATTALSLFKQFHLTALREGSLLEFRAEAFNALNHPQFSGPNTTVGSLASAG